MRYGLAKGMLRRLTDLAGSDVDFKDDRALLDALDALIGMRGLVTDAMADGAIEARYTLFERKDAELQAEQSSKALESWLDAAERAPTRPDATVLLEVAAAARRVFDRVGRWIKARDPGRLDIALAAYVQRMYAPHRPRGHTQIKAGEAWIHCVEYDEKGLVLAAMALESEINQVAQASASGNILWKAIKLSGKRFMIEPPAFRTKQEHYNSATLPMQHLVAPDCRT